MDLNQVASIATYIESSSLKLVYVFALSCHHTIYASDSSTHTDACSVCIMCVCTYVSVLACRRLRRVDVLPFYDYKPSILNAVAALQRCDHRQTYVLCCCCCCAAVVRCCHLLFMRTVCFCECTFICMI